MLFAVDTFIALTAIGGGIALVSGLEASRFPLGMLKGAPFNIYVSPGLTLAVVGGGSAAMTAVATLMSLPAGGLASVAAGVVMMGWVSGEVLLLKQTS